MARNRKSKNTRSPFAARWASQTQLGRPYGLSAIAVGKRLSDAGLRDPDTKRPTPKALDEGWAIATPLRDGREHYMWSREKAKALFDPRERLSPAERHAEDIRAARRQAARLEAEGQFKLADLTIDHAWESVPAQVRPVVEALLMSDA